MKNREKKLNMIYKHDEVNNDKLTDRIKKAETLVKINKWVMKQMRYERSVAENSDLL